MENQNKLQIVHLFDAVKDLKVSRDDHEKRLRTMESFKDSTIEKLIVVFDKLKELQEGDRWIKRVFITALVGSTLSAFSALIVWAIQN